MVLSWLMRQLLMYGGLVLVAVAVAVIVRLRHRIRQRWLRWLPPLAIPIGLVLFYSSYTHRFEYVRVETVHYGRALAIDNSPTVIPPSTSAHFTRIHHVGPRDTPPAEVTDDVNLGMSYREWLTWDEK
jgi:hypothetical protein